MKCTFLNNLTPLDCKLGTPGKPKYHSLDLWFENNMINVQFNQLQLVYWDDHIFITATNKKDSSDTLLFQGNRIWPYMCVATAALTLKLIFILYSTPSFRIKACFLKASSSPVRNQKKTKCINYQYLVHHSHSDSITGRIQDKIQQYQVNILYLIKFPVNSLSVRAER